MWLRRLFAGAVAPIVLSVLAMPLCMAAASEDRIVDLAVNDLPLLSPALTEPVLATARATVLASVSLRYTFANADGSQTLTLTVHPGSERYSVAEVSVGFTTGQIAPPILPGRPETFTTQNGIQLGMVRAEVEALLGEPAYTVGDAALYELSGDAEILRRHNMPLYEATYGYDDDRLVGFQFGFPPP